VQACRVVFEGADVANGAAVAIAVFRPRDDAALVGRRTAVGIGRVDRLAGGDGEGGEAGQKGNGLGGTAVISQRPKVRLAGRNVTGTGQPAAAVAIEVVAARIYHPRTIVFGNLAGDDGVFHSPATAVGGKD